MHPVALLVLLLACGSDAPVWAMNTVSAVPDANGVSGTQTWTFFTDRWGKAKEDDAFVCARAQTFTGVVTSAAQFEGCPTCLVAYDLVYEEMGSDCDDALATDPAYTVPETFAIGDVAEDLAALDPQGGESLGWYAVYEGVALDAYGFAWDDALDWGGYPGPPGWNEGQAYTLWPAFAWDLAGDGG